MKPNRIYPSDDQRNSYNISKSFNLHDTERLIEIRAFGLPSDIHCLIEQSYQYDDCASENWVVYNKPCCETSILTSDNTRLYIVTPGKFRLVLLKFNGSGYEAASVAELSDIEIVTTHLNDQSGTLRSLFHCCN